MANKPEKFKVCLKCGTALPILPEVNTHWIENAFEWAHMGHSLTILTEKELNQYSEKRALAKILQRNHNINKAQAFGLANLEFEFLGDSKNVDRRKSE